MNNYQYGLAAMLEFNSNMLIIIAIISIISKNVGGVKGNDFLIVLEWFLNVILSPLRIATGKISNIRQESICVLFIALVIPIQIIGVAFLRGKI